MKLEFYALSDVGKLRERNEDTFKIEEGLGLFVIADGMGGHIGGDVASQVAVDSFVDFIKAQVPLAKSLELKALVSEALIYANAQVRKVAIKKNLLGMGTTLSALLIHKKNYYIAHVGDTRIYLLQDGTLKALTIDDTLAATLIARGELKAEDVYTFPFKHILVQALGTTPYLEPQVYEGKLEKGNRFLLSSDGLHDYVREHELVEILQENDLEQVCKNLIQQANDKYHGPDNITVILIQMT